MFTGLIREMARVVSLSDNRLRLQARYRPKIGDSVAINGVCLTVTELFADGFAVELSHETQAVVALENFKERVHMEPAMQMGDRFEGHIVQGHVDTVGTIERIVPQKGGTDFFIAVEPEYLDYIAPKGSIAIDGVSLTVNEVNERGFRLTIIPHTYDNTLFRTYRVGDRVNIETDLFARYVAHLLKRREQTKPDWAAIEKIQALY